MSLARRIAIGRYIIRKIRINGSSRRVGFGDGLIIAAMTSASGMIATTAIQYHVLDSLSAEISGAGACVGCCEPGGAGCGLAGLGFELLTGAVGLGRGVSPASA